MSAEPLLEKTSNYHEDVDVDIKIKSADRRPRRCSLCIGALLFHLVVITIYTVVFSFTLEHLAAKYRGGSTAIDSPANEAVRWERKFINNDLNATNRYKGEPRKELDDAWRDLFQYNNIRVTKEELDRMNRTSTQLADGSGDYLAALDVYHHLHCVKMIRQYLHPAYYQMPDSVVDIAEHIDHCLDALRQVLMCRAEVSLTTYEWLPDNSIPWPQLSYEHTCVNFEAIHQWAGSRAINIFEPQYLVHPTRGPSFPHGDPN